MKNFPSASELKEGCMLLIDKPYKVTSFAAIDKIKHTADVKIGHAGTLDPLATGLLICCTGKFTKKIADYQRLTKEYTGIFHLGATTPTYDLESEPGDFKSIDTVSIEDIMQATERFKGEILQKPPIHSAIKKDGKRAYKLARKGEEIVLEARPVTIYYFDITKVEFPEVHFKCACSTGTYIRSLASDFGEALGCGAYLQSLRRTKIGDYNVDDAPEVGEWMEYLRKEKTNVNLD
jgi:tRNA pseudouridine55 synthase